MLLTLGDPDFGKINLIQRNGLETSISLCKFSNVHVMDEIKLVLPVLT